MQSLPRKLCLTRNLAAMEQMARKSERLKASATALVLLLLASIPVALMRLFGILFFAGTESPWAVVPLVALVGLMVLSFCSVLFRATGAIVLLSAYLCSVYFHGWEDLMKRIAGGQNGVFDTTEAVLVFMMTAYCLLHKQDRRYATDA